MLDVRTLFAVLVMLNALSSLILALFWRTQKTYPGFGLWVACNAAQAAFYLLYMLRGAIPDFWSIVVANALTTLAVVWRLEGIKRFLGAPRMWLPNYLAPAAVFLLFAFFTYGWDSLQARGALVMLPVSLLLGRSAWILIRQGERQTRQLFLMVAALQIARICVMTIRFAIAIVTPENISVIAPTPANIGSLLSLMVIDIALTMSFLMLNSQRLALELTAAQRHAEENSRRLADIIAFLPDATLVIDQRGRVVAWNRAIEKLTGVPAAEIVGKGDYAYTIPFHGERRPMLIDRALPHPQRVAGENVASEQNEDVPATETFAARPRGKLVWLSAQARPLFDMGGACVGAIETIRDITKSKRVEAALRESEFRFRSIVEQLSEGIILLDERGTVIEYNLAAEEITGIDQARALGMTAWDFHYQLLTDEGRTPGAYEELQSFYRQLLDSGWSPLLNQLLDAEFQRADGTRRFVSQMVFSIKTSRGYRLCSVSRDITEAKLAEEGREQLIEDLDAFSHMVAHDLKAPLSLIMGHVDVLTLDDGTLAGERRQKSLEALAGAVHKMDRIIEELLLLAQVRGAEIARTPVEMGGVVAEACQRLAGMIEEEEAEIIVPAAWPTAMGYAPWVEEVWANYLSNAIKYGGRPPRIEVGATVQADGLVRFWVRDNGAGIRVEDQGRLFMPFTRLDQVRARGHGLGLSIVRRIVERLGGQVGMESAGVPGEGCTFFFTLPAAGD